MTSPKALMVILSDRLSEFMGKGVVTDRRYNPGNVFSSVHIVLTNDDRCDPVLAQRLVGDAQLHLHNVPAGFGLFARSLGWRPWLLGSWTRQMVDLARRIKPDLVYCLGTELNGWAAREIKRQLAIPYVVRVRTEPDRANRSGVSGVKATLIGLASTSIERLALRDADYVLPMYSSIVPFLDRLGIKRYQVVHSAVNPTHLHAKPHYRLASPVRIICVGRQMSAKRPDEILRAVAQDPGLSLLMVGDGPNHDHLQQLAAELGLGSRIEFRRRIPNDELCAMLSGFDIFASHSDYWELPQTVMEAMLSGLPVVVNRGHCGPGTELSDQNCLLVDNSAASYGAAFRRLIEDDALRETLGRAGLKYAREHFATDATEATLAKIYRDLALSR